MPRSKRDPRRPDAVDVAVGRNLRLWRVARGLSQSQLAKRLGVTFQQVQKYEIGGNRVSMGRLVKAAGILGVPVGAHVAMSWFTSWPTSPAFAAPHASDRLSMLRWLPHRQLIDEARRIGAAVLAAEGSKLLR